MSQPNLKLKSGAISPIIFSISTDTEIHPNSDNNPSTHSFMSSVFLYEFVAKSLCGTFSKYLHILFVPCLT